MVNISFEQALEKVKNAECGVYLFFGEEDYFIDTLLMNLYKNDCEKYSFWSDECKIKDVLNQTYQQSMFTNKQIFIIRDIQKCDFFKNKENYSFIKNYITKFKADNIILFIYRENLTKTSDILQCFDSAFVFNSKKLNEGQIKIFINQYCEKKKINLNGKYTEQFYRNFGDNLKKIISEIDKNIECIDFNYSREFNAFEFINAISTKNFDKVVLMTKSLKSKDKNELIPLFGLIFSFFQKLIAFKKSKNKNTYPLTYKKADNIYTEEEIKNIIEDIKYCDLCMKGVKTTLNMDILKYFTTKIALMNKKRNE